MAEQKNVQQKEMEVENTVEDNLQTMSYATNMPIYLVYNYLKEDYDTKGYKDALCNPDTVFKTTNISLIRSNLEILFKQVTLRYSDDLRETELAIQTCTDAGLLDVVKQLKARKETCEKHLDQIKDMETDMKSNAPYMVGMIGSYERGFLRGIAAQSLETFKKYEL